jgi:hypothetical protein
MFRLVQHEWEETGMHLRYLRAKHPEIAGGSVHHVPGRLIPCHPVSSVALPGRAEGCCRYTFTTVPETQKALSLPGKGLDLRRLVAGEGFEPSTSGL